MYKVELYIEEQRVDLFGGEAIEMNLTVQNIKDISKVFGDYSNTFTLPATPVNNAVFSHYYNVDVVGGFDARSRVDAFIEVNNNLYKVGVIDLEGVEMRKGEPFAYKVGFYSKTTALKDLFGDDKLNVLNLSAYNHNYNDTNIKGGIEGYVPGTNENVIYPLISPVANWFYDSDNGNHDPANIHYHGQNDEHGIFFYDLKPAIKLKRIIDAIGAKYGVTFNSSFFDSADFNRLFMWCHRRVGYMFKDQPLGREWTFIDFTSNTSSSFNLTTDIYTIDFAQYGDARFGFTTTTAGDYKIGVFVNGVLRTWKSFTSAITNEYIYLNLNLNDQVQFALQPSDDWAGQALNINSVSVTFDYRLTPASSYDNNGSASTSTTIALGSRVIIKDQLPEQKISEFLSSLVKMFNLVIIPTSSNTYDIEPLDTWYAEGTARDITKYVDTSTTSISKPNIYNEISFKYNATEAILGEEYRLQTDIGYGDLRAQFNVDGDVFEIEVGFDNLLCERLNDINENASITLTNINVGKSITRELQPYIGKPVIFYAPDRITYDPNNPNDPAISYVPISGGEEQLISIWLVSNTNAIDVADVTRTINFGTEVDPYHLQGVQGGLYATYWSDYITDLYDTSRRLFTIEAQLPLPIMLQLKLNDKLIIGERAYIINSLKLNLTTGKAQLELLNDV